MFSRMVNTRREIQHTYACYLITGCVSRFSVMTRNVAAHTAQADRSMERGNTKPAVPWFQCAMIRHKATNVKVYCRCLSLRESKNFLDQTRVCYMAVKRL
jgi:hypothetical protein